MKCYIVSVAIVLSTILSIGKGDNQNLSCAIQNSTLNNSSIRDHCEFRSSFAICPAFEEGMCVLGGYCVTYDVSKVDIGLCLYSPQNFSFCYKPLVEYYLVPSSLPLSQVNDFTCGAYNREGLLCSQCKPGYGPAVYAFSLMCVECSSSHHGWVLYFFLVLFPITVFFVIVIVFNIRATSPPFMAFVFMCQMYCNIDRIYVPLGMKLSKYDSTLFLFLLHTVRLLCGIWNLDFFRYLIPPFCVDQHISNLQALALEYVSVVYPIVLVIVAYIYIELHARNCRLFVVLWKPFHQCFVCIRRSWDPKASVIHAFSTFLLLSFTKILLICSYTFLTSQPNSAKQKSRLRLLFDPNVAIFSEYHIPYLICSVILLILLFFLPLLLLCLYPTRLMRGLVQCCLPTQWQCMIKAFTDTFQGHYKDGTNGTRDYRAMPALYFILILVSVAVFQWDHPRNHRISVLLMFCIVASLLFALLRPCNKILDNIFQSVVIALTALIIIMIGFINFEYQTVEANLVIMLLFVMIPHVVFGGWIVSRIARKMGLDVHLHSLLDYCPKLCKRRAVVDSTGNSYLRQQTSTLELIVDDPSEQTPLLQSRY